MKTLAQVSIFLLFLTSCAIESESPSSNNNEDNTPSAYYIYSDNGFADLTLNNDSNVILTWFGGAGNLLFLGASVKAYLYDSDLNEIIPDGYTDNNISRNPPESVSLLSGSYKILFVQIDSTSTAILYSPDISSPENLPSLDPGIYSESGKFFYHLSIPNDTNIIFSSLDGGSTASLGARTHAYFFNLELSKYIPSGLISNDVPMGTPFSLQAGSYVVVISIGDEFRMQVEY